MTTILDSIGREYQLSDDAILALSEAITARQAEHAFEQFAPDVPAMSRCAVWQAIGILFDSVEL